MAAESVRSASAVRSAYALLIDSTSLRRSSLMLLTGSSEPLHAVSAVAQISANVVSVSVFMADRSIELKGHPGRFGREY
jgi:hypothetical protein